MAIVAQTYNGFSIPLHDSGYSYDPLSSKRGFNPGSTGGLDYQYNIAPTDITGTLNNGDTFDLSGSFQAAYTNGGDYPIGTVRSVTLKSATGVLLFTATGLNSYVNPFAVGAYNEAFGWLDDL